MSACTLDPHTHTDTCHRIQHERSAFAERSDGSIYKVASFFLCEPYIHALLPQPAASRTVGIRQRFSLFVCCRTYQAKPGARLSPNGCPVRGVTLKGRQIRQTTLERASCPEGRASNKAAYLTRDGTICNHVRAYTLSEASLRVPRK